MSRKLLPLNREQSGLVAIIVCTVLTVIMSLITIGFARIMGREQRAALDRQLSTQAFYAAESGVNDAISNSLGSDVSQCDPTRFSGINNLIGGSDVSYTCLLVDTSPPELIFDEIGVNEAQTVRINSSLNRFDINWQAINANTNFGAGTGTNLPNAAAWGGNRTGMLRIDVSPVNNGTTRDALLTGSRTFFLYPSTGAAANQANINFATDDGTIVQGNCNANRRPMFCSVQLQGIPANTELYVRMRAIYNDVTVSFTEGIRNGNQADFAGVQRLIDSTGRHNDVLRRIQVRVPISPPVVTADTAIESADTICKRIRFNGTGATDSICDVIPPPPPPPPVTGGNGNAGIRKACELSPGGCAGGGNSDGVITPHFNESLVNDSNNPPGNVTGCRWDFGDGVTQNSACRFNDVIRHTWPSFPVTCLPNGQASSRRTYTVRLVVFLSSGGTASTTYDVRVPTCH